MASIIVRCFEKQIESSALLSLRNAWKKEKILKTSSSPTKVPSGLNSMGRSVSERRVHQASREANISSRSMFGLAFQRDVRLILIFTGIMKKEFYVNKILFKVFLPFTQDTFKDVTIFNRIMIPNIKVSYLFMHTIVEKKSQEFVL